MAERPATLVKVHIDLPNHWWMKGESIWAVDLGDNLYELQNVPFCAYGLNCGDVVRASVNGPGLKPEVCGIVSRSGNRTVRINFCDALPKSEQQPVIDALSSLGAQVERATSQFLGLNVPANASYDAICAYLRDQERAGLLDYETCEQRVPGSFDDAPQEQ
jgi:hypothetical protein